jgi:hypothetical protein
MATDDLATDFLKKAPWQKVKTFRFRLLTPLTSRLFGSGGTKLRKSATNRLSSASDTTGHHAAPARICSPSDTELSRSRCWNSYVNRLGIFRGR